MYLWKTYRVVSNAQRCALETPKDNAEKIAPPSCTFAKATRREVLRLPPPEADDTEVSETTAPHRGAHAMTPALGSLAPHQTHLARGKPLRGQHREKPVPRPVPNYGETESNSAVTACSRGGAVRANDSIASRRSRGKRASTSAAPSS